MFFVESIQVECDKETILNAEMHTECIESDKWGDCLEKKPVINGVNWR